MRNINKIIFLIVLILVLVMDISFSVPIAAAWKVNSTAESEDAFIMKFDTDGNKQWTQHHGTQTCDSSSSIAVDADGNMYITGGTAGNLDGNESAGYFDIFVTKYDFAGNRIWTELLGTPDWESGSGIALDAKANVYIVGSTYGNLDGNKNNGSYDIFIAKYDSDGNGQWTKLLGTDNNDEGEGIAVDSKGNIYITGGLGIDLEGSPGLEEVDLVVAKYDTDGNRLWMEQLGTPDIEWGKQLALDANDNVYVTGGTYGELGGKANAGEIDIFIAKYNSDGKRLWTEVLGTSGFEWGESIAVNDTGNVYVTGATEGDLGGITNSRDADIFVVKYNPDGNRIWTKLLDTPTIRFGKSIIVDEKEQFYITGGILSEHKGQTDIGICDLFTAKFDSDGNRMWTDITGTPSLEYGEGIAMDANGNVYVTGLTRDDLD